MKKAIVTGGAGFVGSTLTDELIKQGWEVTILDNLSTGKKENINPEATFILCDISTVNQDELISYMTGGDAVFHTAALARVQPSIQDPVSFDTVNTGGTVKVLDAANKAGIKRVVYSASSSAYGDQTIMPLHEEMPTGPISPYALQKYIGEQYCELFSTIYGLETVSLRYFNVYGERMLTEGAYTLVMGVFAKQKLEGKPLTITNDGEQTRDFTYVGDVVNANILAATSDKVGKGEVINIGAGNSCSVNQIAEAFGGSVEYIGDRLEPKDTLADNSKAKKLLSWEPTKEVLDWIPTYKQMLGI
jgi:UDP-glucose 4-epimerase